MSKLFTFTLAVFRWVIIYAGFLFVVALSGVGPYSFDRSPEARYAWILEPVLIMVFIGFLPLAMIRVSRPSRESGRLFLFAPYICVLIAFLVSAQAWLVQLGWLSLVIHLAFAIALDVVEFRWLWLSRLT